MKPCGVKGCRRMRPFPNSLPLHLYAGMCPRMRLRVTVRLRLRLLRHCRHVPGTWGRVRDGGGARGGHVDGLVGSHARARGRRSGPRELGGVRGEEGLRGRKMGRGSWWGVKGVRERGCGGRDRVKD